MALQYQENISDLSETSGDGCSYNYADGRARERVELKSGDLTAFIFIIRMPGVLQSTQSSHDQRVFQVFLVGEKNNSNKNNNNKKHSTFLTNFVKVEKALSLERGNEKKEKKQSGGKTCWMSCLDLHS